MTKRQRTTRRPTYWPFVFDVICLGLFASAAACWLAGMKESACFSALMAVGVGNHADLLDIKERIRRQ